jgi:hypothetical protein
MSETVQPHFKCPDCGRVSYHPVDIREGWCNVCKKGDLERSFAASEHCHSNNDGECEWERCPQLRDKEPHATGRHCPLAVRDSTIPGWEGT